MRTTPYCSLNILLLFQVRTSYVPNEILWGYRFDNDIVSYDKDRMVYNINHNKLNDTFVDNTPRLNFHSSVFFLNFNYRNNNLV